MSRDDRQTLYRMYSRGNVLLYVGISANAGARFQSHASTAGWWSEVARIEVEHFPNRKAVSQAEQAAIGRERPIYNKAHNWDNDSREQPPLDSGPTWDFFPDMPDPVTPKWLIDRGIRSRSQLSRDMASGALPSYKIGSRIFIRKQDINNLIRKVRSA